MQKSVALVFLLGVLAPSLAQRTLPTQEINTGSFACPTQTQEQTVTGAFRDGIQAEVTQNILPGVQCRVGECQSNPASSCQDVADRGPGVTGWYWIGKCDGSVVQVYCTMDNPCGCSGTGAWMRIGLLNMSDPTATCPSGMGLNANPRSCSRNTRPGNCASFFFGSNFVQYSRVCGRATGYGESSPDAFAPFQGGNRGYTIDDPYFDGMAITYGFSPRKHIWTFAAGVDDIGSSAARCPCSNPAYNTPLPPFIGNDWFCEAGPSGNWQRGVIYSDNPLWDGTGCSGAQSTCCTANNPPWFCKTLPSPTRDDIECRACGDQNQGDEDVLIALVELYVQ